MEYYICGSCGYDLRTQWDHGVDDRCMGCIERQREADNGGLCDHCGQARDFCQCHC